MIRYLTLGFTLLLMVVSGVSYAQENNGFAMEMLPFDAEANGASFLEDEAGISAYGAVINVDLDLAENAFKTVEKKTDQYIVGSVALDNYGETDDVHVYVDISGWIIAYYLQDEKASKIIDWQGYKSSGNLSNTKLVLAIGKVCACMYVYIDEIKYYDFRYTHATKIMIIVDEESENNTTETFRVEVPSDYFVLNATWSLHVVEYHDDSNRGDLKIDDILLYSGSSTGSDIWEGMITPVQLSPNVFHEITLYNVCSGYSCNGDSWAALMLIYSEPSL